MTKKLVSKLVLLFALATVAGGINAQQVSNKYNVDQIDTMYREHKADRPRDIFSPSEVNSKFNTDFPNARDIEWEKSKVLYEVEFEIGRHDYDAYYDMDGNLVMYKCELNANDLPVAVRDAALAKHPDFRIDDAEKIVKGNNTTYKVEIEKGKLEIKMRIGEDGTIVSEYLDI